MNATLHGFAGALGCAVALFACSPDAIPPPAQEKTTALPPEPTVTYTAADAQPEQKIEHGE
jgi:hypothetical protein